MRAVIASRIFSPEPAAASFRLAALAESLALAGASVTVLTSRSADGRAATTVQSVRVRRWPVLRDKAGYVRGYLQYLSFDVPLFFRLLVVRRPDVVVVEPPPTTGTVVRMVCALRRIPYVYYAADIWSDAAESTGAPGLVVRFVRALERGALRSASGVLSVSAGVAERVRSMSGRTDVAVVGNGVDTVAFSRDGESRGTGPFGVYAGTTSEWQGADIFIRAMPRVLGAVPDARLVFIGQGSAWAGLRETSESLGLTCVDFFDVAPPEEAAAWLRSARAGLVSLKPGQGYDFAFPTKIYAALATGTPVVFTGGGPAVGVIRDNRLGSAVEYDVEAVASALIELFRTPADAARRAELSAWVEANASLRGVATHAAEVVRTAAG